MSAPQTRAGANMGNPTRNLSGSNDYVALFLEGEPLLRDVGSALRKCVTLTEACTAIAEGASCQIPVETLLHAAAVLTHPAAIAGPPRIRVVIDGTPLGRRNSVYVSGTQCAVRTAPLVLLLRLALRARQRWYARSDLRLDKKCNWPTRLLDDLAPASAAGFEIVQCDRLGQFRITHDVEFEIAWEALAEHDNAEVRRIAIAELTRARAGRR